MLGSVLSWVAVVGLSRVDHRSRIPSASVGRILDPGADGRPRSGISTHGVEGMTRPAGGEKPPLQHPLVTVIEGGGMDADEAAWALVAEAASEALKLPDLSESASSELTRLECAALRCAGLPPRRSQQATSHLA